MLLTPSSTRWLTTSAPCLCRNLQPISSSSISNTSRTFSSTSNSSPLIVNNVRSSIWTLRKKSNNSSSNSRRIIGQRNFSSTNQILARDPYSVLGVSKDASSSEIKKNYYQLAKKFHPDSNKEKSAKEKFVEIQDAYDILSDDKKRADFDRFGAASQQQGFDSDAYARASSSFGGGFGDFSFGGGGGQQQGSDIFESLFGAFGRGGQARPGQANHVGEDIEVVISLPFVEAAKGTKRTIEITPVVDCQTCTGTGMKAGVSKTTCKSCGGSGTKTFTIQSGFQMASTCNSCQGTGSTVPPGSSCGSCAGVGKVRERKSVDVDVPAGVDQGMRIRVNGSGDAPIGGKGRTGDLYIRINVLPSKIFRRQGSNLYQDVSVPFYSAILGGVARVATLDEDVQIKVPRGTQPGQEMTMRGKGVKVLNKSDYGDLVVRFNISIPRDLTAEQRRILQQFVDETEVPGSARAKYSPTGTPSSSPTSDDKSATKNWWANLEPESDTPTLDPSATQSPPPPTSASSEATSPSPSSSSSPTTTSTSTSTSKTKSTEPKLKSTTPPKSAEPESKEEKVAAGEKGEKKIEKESAKEEEEDHTVLGDLWKGIRSRLPKK